MAALHITKENFEEEAVKSEKKVLLDFWAAWCGPCQMLLPIIEELSEELQEVKVCKINVDEEPELAEKYGVMTIPTLIVMENGKEVSKSIGVRPKSEIIKMVQ